MRAQYAKNKMQHTGKPEMPLAVAQSDTDSGTPEMDPSTNNMKSSGPLAVVPRPVAQSDDSGKPSTTNMESSEPHPVVQSDSEKAEMDTSGTNMVSAEPLAVACTVC